MSEFVGYTPEDKSNNNLQSRVDKVAGLVSHLMNTSNSDEEAWIKRAGIFQEIQTEIGYGFRKVEDLLLVQNDNNKTDEQKKLAEEAEELLVLGTAKALMGGDIQDKEAIGVGSVMKIKERLPEELKGLEKKVRDSVIDEPEIQKILDPLDIVRKRAAKAGETGQKVLEDQVNKAQEKLILLEVDSTKEDQLGMVVEWLGEEGNGFKNTGRDIDMAEDYEDYIEQARRRGEFDGKRYGDVEGFDRVSGVQLPPEFMNGMRGLRENDIEGAKKIIATTFVKMSENPLFFASWWQQNTASQVETVLNSSLGYTNLSSNETERKNYQEIRDYTFAVMAVLGMQTEDRNADSNSDNLGQFSPPKEMAHALHWDDGGNYYDLLKDDTEINAFFTEIFNTAFSSDRGGVIVKAFSDVKNYDSQNDYLLQVLQNKRSVFNKEMSESQLLSKGRIAMAMFEVDYMPEWIRWAHVNKLSYKQDSHEGNDITWLKQFNDFDPNALDYNSFAFDSNMTTVDGDKIGYKHPRVLRPWDLMSGPKAAYQQRPEIVWGMERVLGGLIEKRMMTNDGHWITLSGHETDSPNNVDIYGKYGKLMSKVMGGPQGTEFDNMTSMDEILPLAANYWGKVNGNKEFGNFLADIYCLKADAMFYPGYPPGAKQVYYKIAGLDLFSGEAEKKKALEGMMGPDANFAHGWVAELRRLYNIDLTAINNDTKLPVYPKFYNAFYRVFMDTPDVKEAVKYFKKAEKAVRNSMSGDVASFAQRVFDAIGSIK